MRVLKKGGEKRRIGGSRGGWGGDAKSYTNSNLTFVP